MTHPLDSRQVRIALWLLDQTVPQSTETLANGLGLSQRVVRYRLAGLETYLGRQGLTLAKRRGIGLIIEGSTADRQHVLDELTADTQDPSRLFAKEERSDLVRALLLERAPDTMTLEEIQHALEVSLTSARRDAKECEPWFEEHGLLLNRRPGVGMALVGTETAIRRATTNLLFEAIPDVALKDAINQQDARSLATSVSAGMRQFIGTIPLYACGELVRLQPGIRVEQDVLLPMYLAVTAWRIRLGHAVAMDAGQLRSLIDHPVFATAEGLVTGLGELTASEITQRETAALTEVLLGLVELHQKPDNQSSLDPRLLDGILELAANELHPVLRDDTELRKGLGQHLDRLAVRMRYQLPVHNPLLNDVIKRYPDVHVVAEQIGALITDATGRRVPLDEVGFITMYLSGAMERTHLWPRRRAAVVCPSGMATVWILVSRIQAEFPQLEISDVISASDYDHDAIDADLVISTVDIVDDRRSIVVVNPLLGPDDVRAIARHMTSS